MQLSLDKTAVKEVSQPPKRLVSRMAAVEEGVRFFPCDFVTMARPGMCNKNRVLEVPL
jgi:hypothetical protein